MEDQIINLYKNLFGYLTSINPTNISGLLGDTTDINTFISNVATLVKPIGYSLLALFALLELAQLSERVGNVTGFMGTGLVISVLVKVILCKLVVDNSYEIATALVGLGDDVANNIGNVSTTAINFNNFKQSIKNIFPAWWDIFGQLGFFIISAIFALLCTIAVTIVKVVAAARFVEIFVMSAVSPIPLSTALSKHFNVAPNYIKSLFAVSLQGALLLLVVKVFGTMLTATINGIGVVQSGEWDKLWGMLFQLMFLSLLFLVSSLQTQKWAKSICHAM